VHLPWCSQWSLQWQWCETAVQMLTVSVFFLRSAEPSHPLLLSVQLLLLLALMLACCTVDQFQKERYFNRFFRGATCITTANEAAELP